MTELGSKTQDLVDAARAGDRIPAADRDRIRQALVHRLGAGAFASPNTPSLHGNTAPGSSNAATLRPPTAPSVPAPTTLAALGGTTKGILILSAIGLFGAGVILGRVTTSRGPTPNEPHAVGSVAFNHASA